ncbi:hypothetical protein [Ancylothrix sp. D3o]|nr:hypothetical protein [Ancylothrix sp. D3o]
MELRGPVKAGWPVVFENSAFALRLVDVWGPVDVSNAFNSASQW